MKLLTIKPLLIVSLLAFASCNRKTTSGASHQDSIAQQPQVELLPAQPMASASIIKWHTDIIDSTATAWEETDGYETADVRTFRKTPLRDGAFGGKIKGTPSRIEVAWRFDTYYNKEATDYGVWGGGTGWTRQPLYDSKTNQIILGSLCGRTYYLDFATGRETHSIEVLNTVKGTGGLDPEYANHYVGHGVPSNEPFGTMVIDLQKHQITQKTGRDPKAQRGWGAYDSSPVVAGGYLFWPGENGSIYKMRRSQGKLERVAVGRYTIGGRAPGVESSMAIYRNYGYWGDNHGHVICLDLHTMTPIWHYDNHDDIDATVVCQIEDGRPYIYCGNEVDKQGDEGVCSFVKLDGLTGDLVWEQRIPCNRFQLGEKMLDGGMYGTALPGTGDAKGLIFANVCRNGGGGTARSAGELKAFDRRDGHEVWSTPLAQWAWSSPVSYLNERNECYLFTGDSAGNVYLIRATTGAVVCKERVGSNFESSPCVVGNTAVMGSRQNGIFKFVIN